MVKDVSILHYKISVHAVCSSMTMTLYIKQGLRRLAIMVGMKERQWLSHNRYRNPTECFKINRNSDSKLALVVEWDEILIAVLQNLVDSIIFGHLGELGLCVHF